jgi:hypothetical protein
MTADDLIAELQNYPPDIPVKVYGGDESGEWDEIEYVVRSTDKSLLIW